MVDRTRPADLAPQLNTLILLNMGSILDLPSPEWFGEFHDRLTVHVIDSLRPQNLASLFDAGDEAQRVVVWDDGNADVMKEEREAWEQLMVRGTRLTPPAHPCLTRSRRIQKTTTMKIRMTIYPGTTITMRRMCS